LATSWRQKPPIFHSPFPVLSKNIHLGRLPARRARIDQNGPTFPSATYPVNAYAGVAPIARHRYLVTWYSSRLSADEPWLVGVLGPTDIWQATLDLSQL